MTVLTAGLLSQLMIRTGLNSLEKDVELLDSYLNHARNCGLESLDSASGKLIELGLAERYPTHFKMGGGLEGIGALLGKLKSAVGSLKGTTKDKKPTELVHKPTAEALASVDSTYGDAFWSSYQAKEGDVKVAILSGLVKGGNVASVKTQAEGFVKKHEATLRTGVAAIQKFWTGGEAILKNMSRDTDIEKREQASLDLAIYTREHELKTVDDEIGQIPHGGDFPALSESEAKAAVALIKALLQHSEDIYKIINPLLDVGITKDDPRLNDLSPHDKSEVLAYFGRDRLLEAPAFLAENSRQFMFDIVRGLEQWIAASKQ